MINTKIEYEQVLITKNSRNCFVIVIIAIDDISEVRYNDNGDNNDNK